MRIYNEYMLIPLCTITHRGVPEGLVVYVNTMYQVYMEVVGYVISIVLDCYGLWSNGI